VSGRELAGETSSDSSFAGAIDVYQDIMDQVESVFGSVPLASDQGVDRIPVGPAKLGQRGACLGRGRVTGTGDLALAYDRVYRKGCAIAMLKRLAALTVNPKYGKTANPTIDSISDNGQWFKRYRKDAMAAVGR
jgi:hypothetical protein